MKHAVTVLVTLVVLVVVAVAFVYSGVYDVGADDPHSKLVAATMQTLRERSIDARAGRLAVPDLEDSQRILEGAGHYAAMCTDCHLAPGMQDSEIRPGLYPQPPNLARTRIDPKAAFWVIKHGVKMSGMPAWGASHDDATIWSMVAFIAKLPDLSAAEYRDLVAKAPPDEDMHDHGHGDEGMRGHGDADSGEHPSSGARTEPATTTAPMPSNSTPMQPNAVPAAEAVAQAFQAALARGDRKAVLALLASDVRITEGGHTQSRDEYASGHLADDIAFLHDAKVTLLARGSMSMGDTVMVASDSEIATTHDGKPVTLDSRELLGLRRDGKDFKIVSVQWETNPTAAPAANEAHQHEHHGDHD